MIDRICPTCGGKATVKVFSNEFGQLAKLWKCEGCSAVFGVPHWDYIPRDTPHDFGLAPWTEDEHDKRSMLTWKNTAPRLALAQAFTRGHKPHPIKIVIVAVAVGVVLILRHWL